VPSKAAKVDQVDSDESEDEAPKAEAPKAEAPKAVKRPERKAASHAAPAPVSISLRLLFVFR
jgi:hypothetical protein